MQDFYEQLARVESKEITFASAVETQFESYGLYASDLRHLKYSYEDRAIVNQDFFQQKLERSRSLYGRKTYDIETVTRETKLIISQIIDSIFSVFERDGKSLDEKEIVSQQIIDITGSNFYWLVCLSDAKNSGSTLANLDLVKDLYGNDFMKYLQFLELTFVGDADRKFSFLSYNSETISAYSHEHFSQVLEVSIVFNFIEPLEYLVQYIDSGESDYWKVKKYIKFFAYFNKMAFLDASSAPRYLQKLPHSKWFDFFKLMETVNVGDPYSFKALYRYISVDSHLECTESFKNLMFEKGEYFVIAAIKDFLASDDDLLLSEKFDKITEMNFFSALYYSISQLFKN